MEEVVIEKLLHGGQALGTLSDGRKIFVWNALPGEKVTVRLVKGKRGYAEGIAEEIIESSPDRVVPLDEAYLSTSPWQIMTFDAENHHKQSILEETFLREKVIIPPLQFNATGKAARERIHFARGAMEGSPAREDSRRGKVENPPGVFHYRNKMEYSFWADDNGLHLALFNRGTHGKRIVPGSSIARPEIDATANKMCAVLNKAGIRGSQLKTVVVRCNQAGECVAALFVKDENFPMVETLSEGIKGVVVYFSNPKSPASVTTRKLYKYGDITLSDDILGTPIKYDVNSFFQVNLPVFISALEQIKAAMEGQRTVDIYAGVGTIGISVGAEVLVELDPSNVAMAQKNVADKNTTVIQASSEQALEYITPDASVVFDPPRAGLHTKVVDRVLEVLPPQVIYLSCNPATQARDLAKLQTKYDIKSLTGYNFFPRTPHIESLAVMIKK
jgi:23S rRNA (uracil1939-C5)-methyltransferase